MKKNFFVSLLKPLLPSVLVILAACSTPQPKQFSPIEAVNIKLGTNFVEAFAGTDGNNGVSVSLDGGSTQTLYVTNGTIVSVVDSDSTQTFNYNPTTQVLTPVLETAALPLVAVAGWSVIRAVGAYISAMIWRAAPAIQAELLKRAIAAASVSPHVLAIRTHLNEVCKGQVSIQNFLNGLNLGWVPGFLRGQIQPAACSLATGLLR
jgi:hypothetical protein